jgi:outer membrane protein assembly factor BamA
VVKKNEEVEESMKDNLRAACGIGLSMQTSAFALEAYYALAVKAHKQETKVGLQFNIGID